MRRRRRRTPRRNSFTLSTMRPGQRRIAQALLSLLIVAGPVAAAPPPGTTMIPNLTYKGQIYTEDCETAALQMALDHEGIHLSQKTLLQAEGLSLKGPVLDSKGDVLQWGDPYTSFVGHPDSSSISTLYTQADGYGTYAANIARVAKQFGGTVLWSGTGLTRRGLEEAVAAGHPVIVWVGDRAGRMRSAPLSYWTAWDGRRVPYPAPSSGVYEHTVLVAGMSTTGPYVYDPLDGARNGSNINPRVGPGSVDWATFLAGLSTFHGMAVVMR
ncbi:MAG TPA: C39 family peptidase [Spirochaetia bacterium]|nr:C39 family peptidase [Spirochaetia bacterium]